MKLFRRTMGSQFALEIHKYFRSRRKFKLLSYKCYLIIIIVALAELIFSPIEALTQAAHFKSSSDTSKSCYYYATMSKWPLICGSRLKVDPDNQQSGSNNSHSVASFQAIPYAAPPLGLLRFMPPGAPSPSASQRSLRAFELMPGGKLSHVQEHTRPGLGCIRLGNWLSSESQIASNLTTTTTSRPYESEDCLHLSIYVPVNELQHARKSNPNNQQQAGFNVSVKLPGNISMDSQSASSSPEVTQIWPILQAANTTTTTHSQQQNSKLPILVLFSSKKSSPIGHHEHQQQLELASLALKLNAIVIDFNYRTGLLGFLPFSDQHNQNQHSSLGSSSDQPSRRSGARTNHALWDQLGLLHWLRRNGASFGGNPRNVSLLALDNQATQCIQLLAMSPLSKGLFKTAILVHDARQNDKTVAAAEADQTPKSLQEELDSSEMLNFDQLVSLSMQLDMENNDLKARLAATLSQANQVLETSHGAAASSGSEQAVYALADSASPAQGSGKNIFDLIQASNVSQLARLEAQFKLLASEKLVALLEQPTLADSMLFPDFLSSYMQPPLDTSSHLLHQANSNFCFYLKSLQFSVQHKSQLPPAQNNNTRLHLASDFLSLLGGHFQWTDDNHSSGGATGSSNGKTIRTLDLDPSNATQLQISTSKLQTSLAFYNLFNLNLLNSILSGEWAQARTRTHLADHDDLTAANLPASGNAPSMLSHGDDPDSDLIEQSRKYRAQKSSTLEYSVKQSQHSGKPIKALEKSATFESLGQVQIMFGLIHSGDNNDDKNFNSDKSSIVLDQYNSKSHKSIGNFLLKLVARSEPTMSSPAMIAWYKWLELHSRAANNLMKFSDENDNQVNCNASINDDHRNPSYAFKLELKSTHANGNWLHDVTGSSGLAFDKPNGKLTLNLEQNIANFIHSGDPNPLSSMRPQYKQSSQATSDHFQSGSYGYDKDQMIIDSIDLWLPYNSLNRPWRYFINTRSVGASSPHENRSTNLVRNQLNMSPLIHLNLLPFLDFISHYQIELIADEFASEKNLLDDVGACFSELDANFQRIELIDQANYQSGITQASPSSSNPILLSPVQLECLRNSVSLWRDLLRKVAYKELSPINIQLGYQLKRPYANNHTQKHSNSITSRNLVQDDLEYMNNQQQQQHQQAPTSENSEIISSNSHQMKWGNDSSNHANKTKSLSQSYKEALGSALGIVIGSGLLILLLNLTVVLIIALRARESASRNQRVADSNQEPELDGKQDKPIQLETIIRKPALKQSSSLVTSNNQSPCDNNDDSQVGSTSTMRKQLKFNLSDEFDLEQQKALENLMTQTALNYEILNNPDQAEMILQEQDFFVQSTMQNLNLTNDLNENNNLNNTPILDSSSISQSSHMLMQQHQQQQQKHHHHHTHNHGIYNEVRSIPSDQWSQTVCSEHSSNQENYNQSNYQNQQSRNNSNKQHQHQHRCPMRNQGKYMTTMNIGENHYAFSTNSSATISVTPPNNQNDHGNDVVIEGDDVIIGNYQQQSLYGNHASQQQQCSVHDLCSPVMMKLDPNQAQEAMEYGFFSGLELSLQGDGPLAEQVIHAHFNPQS